MLLQQNRTVVLKTLNLKTKVIVFTVILMSILKGSDLNLNFIIFFSSICYNIFLQRQVLDGKIYY